MLSGQARAENSTRSCPGFSPHVRGSHFACKVRGTNIVAAKHAQKIQQGHAPDFATCSWPSLCEQSELQCCAPDIATCSWRPSTRKKLTRSCPRFSPHIRGPHFASKVSYNAVAPDFRHASVPLINPCFNSIKHPIRFHGNSKTLHPSSEGLYYLSTRGRQ